MSGSSTRAVIACQPWCSPTGFIITDATLQTTLEGVFAAGDVRQGSTKQAASAAGEGAAAALMIRQYLQSIGEARTGNPADFAKRTNNGRNSQHMQSAGMLGCAVQDGKKR